MARPEQRVVTALLDDFLLHGELFGTRRPSRSHLIAAVRQLDQAKGAERLRRMDAIVCLFLTDESRVRWATLRERVDDPVTIGMLTEIVEWLISTVAPEVADVAEDARQGFVHEATRKVHDLIEAVGMGQDDPVPESLAAGCSWTRPRQGRSSRSRRRVVRRRLTRAGPSRKPDPDLDPPSRARDGGRVVMDRTGS